MSPRTGRRTARPEAERSPKPSAPISQVAGRQFVPLLLAAQGLGDMNHCQALVAQGRVSCNGQPVLSAMSRAHPLRDQLAVDGQPIALTSFCRYLLFHKPYRVLTAFTDPEGRATIADYVPVPDVYAVGRLDYDSEGLLLLTDDGWLNHRLTHPRYEHPKTYWVQVEQDPDKAALSALRGGVLVKGRETLAAEVERLNDELVAQIAPRSEPIRYRVNVPTAWLRIVLREGRKRQVRHMTAAVGYPTLRLIRMAIGPLQLGDLAPGAWRDLTKQELHALTQLARHAQGAGPRD